MMFEFDAAQTLSTRMEVLDRLLKVRRLIMDAIGWPKPPTLRGGSMPAILGGMANHNPLLDLDAEVVGPAPSEPSETGP